MRSDKSIECYFFGVKTKGNTGFIIACYKFEIQMIELLLQNFTDIVEQRNDNGDTGYDRLDKHAK